MKTFLKFKTGFKSLYFFTLLGCTFFSIAAFSQPPAQGPPLPINQNNNLGLFVVMNTIENTIQKNLDTVNAQIARKKDSTNIGAHLSYTYKTYQPAMVASTLFDAPNQNEIHIPIIVTYTIDNISWHGVGFFSRTISQSIDVYITCKNWFTTQGALNIYTKVDRAFIDGHSFGEDALDFFIGHYLTDYVDSKIRSALPGSLQPTTTIGTSHCSCLGLNTGTNDADHYKDGYVIFEYRNLGFGNLPPTIYNTIDVNLISIKRLTAHSYPDGKALYKPMEDIQLVFYANQNSQVAHLMQVKEEEVRPLNLGNIRLFKAADYASTVLIARIDQSDGSNLSDSNFEVFYKNQNFGNGNQTLVVTKSYWQPPQHLPGGGTTKPIKVTVPAYELTVNINFHNLVMSGATNR